MSVIAMAPVWRAELPPAEKFVLLTLADHARDDGSHVYPSVPYVAWKCGYTTRHVQRLMAQLVNRGILLPIANEAGGRGRPTVYQIAISQIPLKRPYREPAPDAENGWPMNTAGLDTSQMSPFIEEQKKGRHPGHPLASERVTFKTRKGDIQDIKGDIQDIKGDLGVTLTINNHKKETVDGTVTVLSPPVSKKLPELDLPRRYRRDDLWTHIIKAMKAHMLPGAARSRFEGTHLYEPADGCYVVAARSTFAVEYLAENYADELRRCLCAAVHDPDIELAFAKELAA